jgi:hypothetical protein
MASRTPSRDVCATSSTPQHVDDGAAYAANVDMSFSFAKSLRVNSLVDRIYDLELWNCGIVSFLLILLRSPRRFILAVIAAAANAPVDEGSWVDIVLVHYCYSYRPRDICFPLLFF